MSGSHEAKADCYRIRQPSVALACPDQSPPVGFESRRDEPAQNGKVAPPPVGRRRAGRVTDLHSRYRASVPTKPTRQRTAAAQTERGFADRSDL